MFVNAISTVSHFTRPIKFISRNYKSENVIPGLATMFFVNDSGCAITCKHVAEQILENDRLCEKYTIFKGKANQAQISSPNTFKKDLRILEKQCNYQPGVIVQRKCQFVDVPSPFSGFTITVHPVYDLALIQFHGFDTLNYKADPIFLLEDESEIQQGKSLCRLGFPFPEFHDFQYNRITDDIEWISGPASIPSFPMDGIITRHIADERGTLFGIELSTPGLKGQSGGPLFDTKGRIFGMQFATNHLHLGFDIEKQNLVINGEQKVINNQPFLHVGQCLHINIIKEFLDENHIPYKTA